MHHNRSVPATSGGTAIGGWRQQGGGKSVSAIITQVVVRAQNAWFATRDEESGQTLVEYALIIALVALACIAALGFLSGKIQSLFSNAGSSLGS